MPPWCDEALVFDVPLTTTFRGITRRQGMLLHGPEGWGEWSPFREYPPDEAAHWLAATAEACTQPEPKALRTCVPVNVTVPATDPDAAQRIVRSAANTTAKVKVAARGQTLAQDVARVAAVREALGPSGRLRVDANGGWSVAEALTAIAALAPYDLEYVEQPCASVEELAELRRLLRRHGPAVAIAADESIRRSEDPYRVRDLGAADVAVLKVQPLGGIERARHVAAEIGLPVVVSSALDSSVGLRRGVLLAAALPELPYACGLDTGRLLAEDVVALPLRSIEGSLPVTAPLMPTAERPWLADPATTRWWFQRLDDTLRVCR